MPLPEPGSDFIRGAPNRVMMITLAVTGKGGVGKTSIAAGLERTFARKGNRVIALDMDPSPNLWYSGCGREGQPADIIPLISRGGPDHRTDRGPTRGLRSGVQD